MDRKPGVMGDRLRAVRKSLKLSQQEFAERIGIKRNTIANYESGRNDPVESVVELIKREYGVNRAWLETGEGEMFFSQMPTGSVAATNNSGDVIGQLMEEYGLIPEMRQLIETLVSMDRTEQKIVLGVMGRYVKPTSVSEISREVRPQPQQNPEADVGGPDNPEALTSEEKERLEAAYWKKFPEQQKAVSRSLERDGTIGGQADSATA